MNATHTAAAAPVRIVANYRVTKRLGSRITARVPVHAHRGHAALDLRWAQLHGQAAPPSKEET